MARAVAVSVIGLAPVLCSQQSLSADGTLCISRAEDNGVLNIRPAHLHIDGKPVLFVIGGEHKYIAVPVGHHTVEATSTDPYDPNAKDENGWRSNLQ